MCLFIQKFAGNSAEATQQQASCFAVKDNIDVKNTVSTLGSAAFKGAQQAVENATVVDAFLTAGYRLVGKLNMHELAYGMTGVNETFGTPLNPLFPAMITGGSSSGSAVAVAAGDVSIALGTDTGGSVRLPAACCGVIGFKPSFGRLSRKGIQPQESKLDCVGPLARTVIQIEEAMQVMDTHFKPLVDLQRVTLGVVNVDMSPQVAEAFAVCLERLKQSANLTLVPVSLPLLDEAFAAGLTLISQEILLAFGAVPKAQLGQDVAHRISHATNITATDITAALQVKQRFIEQVDRQLADVDALILPTLPDLPMRRAEALDGKVDLSASQFVRPFNVSGHPAMSLPIAGNRDPIALQLVGQHGADEMICAVARYIESLIELPSYGDASKNTIKRAAVKTLSNGAQQATSSGLRA